MTTGHGTGAGNRTRVESRGSGGATEAGSDQLTFQGVSAVVGLPVKTLRTYADAARAGRLPRPDAVVVPLDGPAVGA